MATRGQRLNRLRVSTACDTSWEAMQGSGRERHCEACHRLVFDFSRFSPTEIEALLQTHRHGLCARLTWNGDQIVTAAEVRPADPLARWSPRPAPVLAAAAVAAWLSAGVSMASPPADAPAAAVAQPEAKQSRVNTTRQDSPSSGATLVGRILFDGNAVAGATVIARNLFDGHEEQAISREDGTFEVGALRSGLYAVEGHAGALFIETATVAVGQTETQAVELTAMESETVVMGSMASASLPLRTAFDESQLVV